MTDGPQLTFLDTNVLAHAHDASEQARQPVARALLEELWRTRAGIVSTQVLTEPYVVATRKFDPPTPRREDGSSSMRTRRGGWCRSTPR